MGSFVVQLDKEFDFKPRVEKLRKNAEKIPFIKVYVRELEDYSSEKQTWLFIYTPLIFPFYRILLMSSFVFSIFYGFHLIFWTILIVSLVLGFFFSKYFPMMIMYIKFKKHIKMV